MIGFGAGLRRGEVLGLRRKDIDLARCKIEVRGQLVVYRDYSVEWKAPKTEAGSRTVSISGELVEVLRDVLRAGLEARMRGGVGADGLHHPPYFTHDGVAWINPERLTQSFAHLCDRAGLPDFTVHGTRHTHRTHLLPRVCQ